MSAKSKVAPVTTEPEKGDGGKLSTGLKCLKGIEKLVIKQDRDSYAGDEVYYGIPLNNYEVLDKDGNRLFTINEEDPDYECCACTGLDGPETVVKGRNGEEILRLSRSSEWFKSKMEIFTTTKKVVASIETKFGMKYSLIIKDGNELPQFKIEGGYTINNLRKNNFKVLSNNGWTQIGSIMSKWTGEDDLDCFELEFPADLALKFKAVLICVCIFIDYLYFEDPKMSQYTKANQNVDHRAFRAEKAAGGGRSRPGPGVGIAMRY